MELVVFCLLLSAVFMREFASDIPFMVRGKTPPSHELRMAKLRRKEAAEARRAERANRSRPVRDYFRALVDHSVTTALQKRRAKWEAIDPVKAEIYARKMAARAAKLRAKAAARERRLEAKATARAQGETVNVAATARHKATAATTRAVDWLRRHQFLADSAPTQGPTPSVDKHAAAGAKPTTSPEPGGDGTSSGAASQPDAGNTGGQPRGDDADAKDTPSPRAPLATVTPIRTTKKEDTEMNVNSAGSVGTGEMPGVSAAIAQTENWVNHLRSLRSTFEMAQANLNQAEVGANTVSAYAAAGEGLTVAVTALEKGLEGLRQSVNVGDSYRANPEAGNAQFVKN